MELMDVRYFNAVIGIVGFVLMVIRVSKRWEEFPTEIRLFSLAMIGFIFCLTELTAEQIANRAPVTINMFVISLTFLLFLYTFWETRHTVYGVERR